MVLRNLQALLGRLYDIETVHDVYDFLVTDRREVAAWNPDEARAPWREPDEQLLLAETPDGAGIALYIDEQVLRRLERADPLGALHDGNLADYCTALEGVSHFLYSTWRLAADAPVSMLELETQAEVDKYWATVFLIADQQGGAFPGRVHERLFDRVGFDQALQPDEADRYRTANRCAAQYCRRLERRFVTRAGVRVEALVRELRLFYRLGCTAKLRHAFC
ncbi:MAG: hypothetical protein HKM03_06360 [Steroidobacteraceae bacterium]|nr:hypothetical protein [Steroidobacteraceae bacterium]